MNTKPLPNLISLKLVAEHLNISLRGVYRLIARGELPRPTKIGSSSKMFEHQLHAYLASLEAGQGKLPRKTELSK
jgi:excisionase family DNA binding protein